MTKSSIYTLGKGKLKIMKNKQENTEVLDIIGDTINKLGLNTGLYDDNHVMSSIKNTLNSIHNHNLLGCVNDVTVEWSKSTELDGKTITEDYTYKGPFNSVFNSELANKQGVITLIAQCMTLWLSTGFADKAIFRFTTNEPHKCYTELKLTIEI
jgi:hypothetical protein